MQTDTMPGDDPVSGLWHGSAWIFGQAGGPSALPVPDPGNRLAAASSIGRWLSLAPATLQDCLTRKRAGQDYESETWLREVLR